MPVSAETRSGSWVWPGWDAHLATEFIQQLRAGGCPESFIEDIVIAEINKDTARVIIPYLQSSNSIAPFSVESKISAIRAHRISTLTRLMGPVIVETDVLIGLPYVEQREEITNCEPIVSVILRRKAAKLKEIQAQTHGFITQEDRMLMEAAEQEAILELQQVLTPEQYRNYEIDLFRQSDFGSELVESFGATNEELDAIDSYRKAQAGLDSAPNRDVAQEQNQAVLKSKLGIARANEFMQHIDPAYREATAFSKRFGLDPTAVDQIIQLRNAAMLTSVQINQPQFDPQQSGTISGYANQAVRDSLTQILGARAAEIYIRDAKYANWAR